MKKIEFPKKASSSSDLYNKIISKNITIKNETTDKRKIYNSIEKIGYYRLSGYFSPFFQGDGPGGKKFKPNVTIDEIINLYEFDSALSILILSALKDIEIALRSTICDVLCIESGPHWYDDKDLFISESRFKNTSKKAIFHAGYDRKNNTFNTDKASTLFMNHYYKKYSTPPPPPAWMIRECVSFSFWSHVYSNLNHTFQVKISQKWRYKTRKPIDAPVLGNWTHTLSNLRNNCAHHQRITNITFPFPPKIPGNFNSLKKLMKDTDLTRIKSRMIVISTLLNSICIEKNKKWLLKIYNLFDEYDKKDVKVAKATDFGVSWKNDLFWNDIHT